MGIGVRRMVALSAAYTLVLTPASLLPMMVATMIDGRGMSPNDAGSVLTPELLAIGIVSIVIGQVQPVAVSIRTWMLAGGLLSTSGHAAAMFASHYSGIALVLTLSGIGGGMLLYALNAAIAMSDHAIREYSIVNAVAALAPVPLPLFMPGLLSKYGAAGPYGIFVAYSLVFSALVVMMPPIWPRKGYGLAGTGGLRPMQFSALMLTVLLPVLAGIALFAFQDFIGQKLGWSASQMGTVITVSYFFSLIGTGAAGWIDDRFGWFAPTAIAIGGLCVSVLISTATRSASTFVVATFVFEIFYFAAQPYLLAACARVDASGQVAATGGGVLFLGIALGPSVGGYLVQNHGVASIGVFMAVCALLAVLLSLQVRRKVETPRTSAAG